MIDLEEISQEILAQVGKSDPGGCWFFGLQQSRPGLGGDVLSADETKPFVFGTPTKSRRYIDFTLPETNVAVAF